MDGIKIMQRVAARGAAIKVLDKPHLDLTTPIGQGLLGLLSAIAEDERQRIAKRSGEGRRAAKARGVKMGAPSKLSEHQRSKAIERLEAGESCSEIGRDMGVSHSTISRLKTAHG
jgi:DNA invertase Pin-like site-specific DNA recombinase